MTDLKKNSHKKLTKLLHQTDDMGVLEEIARRINLGLIPLVMIDFSKLSNKKLLRLNTLTNCSWVLEEIGRRMQDGRISGRVVTLDEVKELYSGNKRKQVG